MTQLENVTVLATSNVYFDGRCVSHSLVMPDGTKKSVGVILPATLTFTTGVPERMEVVAGSCRVRLAGAQDWSEYAAGTSFDVPGDSSFDIEVADKLDYVCSYLG